MASNFDKKEDERTVDIRKWKPVLHIKDRVTIRCKAMGCISKGSNSYNTELHGMFVLYRGSTVNATDNRGGMGQ